METIPKNNRHGYPLIYIKERIMASVVFLMLPLSVLFVFGLMVLAFGDVAFRQVAVSAGGKIGQAPQNRFPVREMASTLNRLTGVSSGSSQRASHTCESFVPSVTEPEARVIVEELRQRGDGELLRVVERSRHRGCACPMLTQTGLCACSIARPLACIGRCVVGGDSPEWVSGLGDSVSEAFRHHLETRHVSAESRRLDEALITLMDHPSDTKI
jgi:hypothetical protein